MVSSTGMAWFCYDTNIMGSGMLSWSWFENAANVIDTSLMSSWHCRKNEDIYRELIGREASCSTL
jgi:hypothetical protein